MKFGTWNVKSMNNSVSLTTIEFELTVYKLDLVGLQGVRWDTAGTQKPGVYYCFY
jgi:exonuclease III